MSTTTLADWPVRRFRPNVVVDGAGEDDLVGRRIAVGSVMRTGAPGTGGPG